MPNYDDRQLAAILEMQDVGEEERKLQQQQAISQQLRGAALAPSAGKDWGSQLARAVQGGLAGYSMNQQDKLGASAAGARGKALANVKGMLMQPQAPMTDPATTATMAQRPNGMGMVPGVQPGAVDPAELLRRRQMGMGYE